MAEVKQIKVLAGTFPAAHGDQARKLKESLKAAGLGEFMVKKAEHKPGYIMVAAECADQEAADEMIKKAKAAKIRICVVE